MIHLMVFVHNFFDKCSCCGFVKKIEAGQKNDIFCWYFDLL